MKNVIRLGRSGAEPVPDDPWMLMLEPSATTTATTVATETAPRILSLDAWLATQPQTVLNGHRPSVDAVCLRADDDAAQLAPYLSVLPLIALHFPRFSDGRAYSQAYLLRTRMGWQGELRAVGDVLRDQLSHMRQCGFDVFALREDKSAAEAIKGLRGMSVLYSRSVIEPRPLFRRRPVTQPASDTASDPESATEASTCLRKNAS